MGAGVVVQDPHEIVLTAYWPQYRIANEVLESGYDAESSEVIDPPPRLRLRRSHPSWPGGAIALLSQQHAI
jgi:hypothetical protein